MVNYREIIREVLISLAEGRVDESLVERLRRAEEELLSDLPEGVEGRAYLRAAEVLRDLRVELENTIFIVRAFRRAMYGGIIAEEETTRHPEPAPEFEPEVPRERTVYSPLEDATERVLVTFKTPVPKFVGVDMKVYGPFSEGDVAFIPSENAVALKRRGVVEVVEE